jgi:hypothetical protein
MRALGKSVQDPLCDPNVLEAWPFAGARLEASRDQALRDSGPRGAGRRGVSGSVWTKFDVLSSAPETGYEELVVDRESVGSGETMDGESSRLGVLRAYDGYSWT